MDAGRNCKKWQGKKTYIQGHLNYQRNRNVTENSKNVHLFTTFELYPAAGLKKGL